MSRPHDTNGLLLQLSGRIGELTTSERWLAHLECQSRFHRYSYANALLIGSQRPTATRVGGFATWRKLGRYVRRGEEAIWILAPMIHPGEEVTTSEERARILRGFRPVAVFDLDQTEGAPLPSICAPLSGEDPEGCYGRLVLAATSFGFAVEDHEFTAGTSGDCSHRARRLRIEARNAPAQRVKTLAHELAHALLHERFEDRGRAELEAESTAYVVCRVLGIDSSDYSLGYVASWAGSGEGAIAGIKASCQAIQGAATRILDAVAAASPSDPGFAPYPSPLPGATGAGDLRALAQLGSSPAPSASRSLAKDALAKVTRPAL